MTLAKPVEKIPLARNFLVLFLSNTFGQVLFLGGTIVIARVVGAVAYGWWGFSHAIFGYLLRGGELGLEVTGIRAIGRQPSVSTARVGQVLVIRIGLAFLLCAATLLVALGGVLPLPSIPLVVVFSVGVFPVALSLEWLFEGLQAPIYSGLARVIKGLVFFGLVFWFINGPAQLALSVWLYVLSLTVPAAVLLLIAWKRIGRFDISVNRPALGALLQEALPIGVATLLSQYVLFFATIYLGFMTIGEQLGLFAASHRLVIFVWAYGIVAANRVLLPRLAYLHNKDEESFRQFVRSGARILLIAALPIGIGGSFLGGNLIQVIYGGAYEGAGIVFQILIWALVVAVVVAVFEVSLIASDRQKTYLEGMILSAVMTTIAVPLGLKMGGIAGVALGMVFAQIVYGGFVIVRSKIIDPIFFFRQSWRIFLSGGIGLVAAVLLTDQPIVMTVAALCIYGVSLGILREVSSRDGVVLLRLMGIAGNGTEK
jgi:O-antigen/teichoic acid export membrane protein